VVTAKSGGADRVSGPDRGASENARLGAGTGVHADRTPDRKSGNRAAEGPSRKLLAQAITAQPTLR
jgi:hypothetical protein